MHDSQETLGNADVLCFQSKYITHLDGSRLNYTQSLITYAVVTISDTI